MSSSSSFQGSAVGVGPGVGHGQDARPGVRQAEVLVGELVAVDGLPAGSIVVGEVAALSRPDHTREKPPQRPSRTAAPAAGSRPRDPATKTRAPREAARDGDGSRYIRGSKMTDTGTERQHPRLEPRRAPVSVQPPRKAPEKAA
uniref:Uncharacterized protein n=1 Tax=Poecilia reticulata TaxID=8081 RepID=A0A3P9PYX2_POERE